MQLFSSAGSADIMRNGFFEVPAAREAEGGRVLFNLAPAFYTYKVICALLSIQLLFADKACLGIHNIRQDT
jgi:hypothetical protein